MDAIYRACAETLLAAARLGEDRNLPAAEVLRQDLLGALRDMVSRCRAAGIADADTAEARYAIVAFMDERVLKSDWLGRAEWMSNPLQLQLYREYTAGENFFARMRALLNRGASSPALEIYYLCLALGFTGAMPGAAGGQAARSYLDAAREPLTRAHRSTSMSPHAIPVDPYPSHPQGRSLWWPLVLACVAVSFIGLCSLSWSLSRSVDRVVHSAAAVDAMQASPASGAR
jgi:type VI secretion system protein ImpK